MPLPPSPLNKKFIHFHAVFAKILQNNRLLYPSKVVTSPPPQPLDPGSWILHYIVRQLRRCIRDHNMVHHPPSGNTSSQEFCKPFSHLEVQS